MSHTKHADVVTYLLRGISGDVWRKARVRAVIEQRDMSEVLRGLIRAYGQERIDVPREKDSRRKSL